MSDLFDQSDILELLAYAFGEKKKPAIVAELLSECYNAGVENGERDITKTAAKISLVYGEIPFGTDGWLSEEIVEAFGIHDEYKNRTYSSAEDFRYAAREIEDKFSR